MSRLRRWLEPTSWRMDEGPAIRERRLRRDLKDNTGIVRAAIACSTVEVPVRVKNEVAYRISAITAASEIVKRSVSPSSIGGCQLKSRARSIKAVAVGCAIEISSSIHKQLAPRAGVVAATLETIERVEDPTVVGGSKFKNRSTSAAAAGQRRSV